MYIYIYNYICVSVWAYARACACPCACLKARASELVSANSASGRSRSAKSFASNWHVAAGSVRGLSSLTQRGQGSQTSLSIAMLQHAAISSGCNRTSRK